MVMLGAQWRLVGVVTACACRVGAIVRPELDEKPRVRGVAQDGLYCLEPWQSLDLQAMRRHLISGDEKGQECVK